MVLPQLYDNNNFIDICYNPKMRLIFVYPISSIHHLIDGDTVSVMLDRGFNDTKKISLRLIGLNAPETRTRRALEKKAGLLVKSVVAKWLEDNRDKKLFATSEAKPKYAGRAIGRMWADSEEDSLNTYLLTSGVVKVYTGGKREFTDEELTGIISKCKDVLANPK